MSYWQDHIAQLKELLQNIEHELALYWDVETLKEKQEQLQFIEKTITNLQKSSTTVPDELRELKFKLIKELDLFKEAAVAKTELQELFAPFQSKSKRKKVAPSKARKHLAKKHKSASRTTMKELIDAGVLPVPLKLSKKYKGKVYQATITKEGHIELHLNGTLQIFNSPSAAAVAASNKSQNGWTWWNIKGESKETTLDTYRQKMKEYEAQGRR